MHQIVEPPTPNPVSPPPVHRGRTMDTRPIRLIDSELDAVFAAARPPKRVLWCEPSQCSHPVLDRTNFPGPRCVPPQDARVRPFR
jgi:hypothetical protein